MTVTVLRFGTNSDHYPFHRDSFSSEDFGASIRFASVNMAFIVLTGAGGALIIRKWYEPTYVHARESHMKMLRNHHFVGLVVAVVVVNGLMAVSVMLDKNAVWYGFADRNIRG